LCHPERAGDQGNEKMERWDRESQEQEACPFSLMDSCHGGMKGNGGKVRTWGEARKGERRAGTGRATRKIGKKKEKKSKKK
jgi:hypothetical protein